MLVIDDEEGMRDSCLQVLDRDGYDVETASDGEGGLDLAREFEPDVAILDLKMPGISDIELLRTFKERNPNTVAVVITGYGTLASAVEAMKTGAYDFLPKPFTPDELRVVVRRAMERRNLECKSAALERDKRLMQDNFAAMISHQLKAPLATAAECVDVTTQGLLGPLSEKQNSMLGRARSKIDHMLSVIEDWLKLSRIESGDFEKQLKPVELEAVLEEAWESSTEKPDRDRISFELIVENDPGPVYGDEGLLGELFGNLFANAVRYTVGPGSVKVTVASERRDLVITVTDSGIGIREEEVPFVFDTFFRGNGARDTQPSGTGLGLPIVKSIVEAHRGFICVTSIEGHGTAFVVRLPKEMANT